MRELQGFILRSVNTFLLSYKNQAVIAERYLYFSIYSNIKNALICNLLFEFKLFDIIQVVKLSHQDA
jgi:hypothetical protein